MKAHDKKTQSWVDKSEKCSELSWGSLLLTCHAAPLTSCPSCFVSATDPVCLLTPAANLKEGGMVGGERGAEVMAERRGCLASRTIGFLQYDRFTILATNWPRKKHPKR